MIEFEKEIEKLRIEKRMMGYDEYKWRMKQVEGKKVKEQKGVE